LHAEAKPHQNRAQCYLKKEPLRGEENSGELIRTRTLKRPFCLLPCTKGGVTGTYQPKKKKEKGKKKTARSLEEKENDTIWGSNLIDNGGARNHPADERWTTGAVVQIACLEKRAPLSGGRPIERIMGLLPGRGIGNEGGNSWETETALG